MVVTGNRISVGPVSSPTCVGVVLPPWTEAGHWRRRTPVLKGPAGDLAAGGGATLLDAQDRESAEPEGGVDAAEVQGRTSEDLDGRDPTRDICRL